MSRGTVVRVGAGILLVVLAVLAAPFVRLALDEGAVPDVSDLPPVPAGVTVVGDDVGCGSGGCTREVTLRAPDGQSAADLAGEVGTADWTCRTSSLLDRRQVCSRAVVVGDDVVVSLYFDRSSIP